MERIVARTRDWKTGDPLDPGNHLDVLIDNTHQGKVAGFIDKATTKPMLGGEIDGAFVKPTIFDNVSPEDVWAVEEIFGPVLSVNTIASIEQAIKVANQTDYGLTASVFSVNGKRANRAARAIRAGTVTINCYGEGDITTPFGGYKQPGFGGRDNGIDAHDQYTELKTIWIDLSDDAAAESVG